MENKFKNYRETIRHLFNSAVLPEIDSTDDFNEKWDIIDSFKNIEKILFEIMVLNPLNISGGLSEPINEIRIVPQYDQCEIHIENPKGDGNRYWDYTLKNISANQIDLCFIEFYDFDNTNQRDYTYYKAKIINCTDKNVIGREALCRVEDYKISKA